MIAELDLLITMPDGTRKQFGALTEVEARAFSTHRSDYWAEIADSMVGFPDLETSYLKGEAYIWIGGVAIDHVWTISEQGGDGWLPDNAPSLMVSALSDVFDTGALHNQAACDNLRSLTVKELHNLYMEFVVPMVTSLRERLETPATLDTTSTADNLPEGT